MTVAFILLLFLLLAGCAALTLFGLPGNWAILIVTLLFTVLVPPTSGIVIGAPVLVFMLLLAILGEVFEFVLSAAGLAKGASPRGAFLALVGSIIGSFFGAGVFSLLPIIGTAIGLILGGALGALLGAFIGEKSLGKDNEESLRLGKIAFWGRLFGSVTKILIAGVLLVIAVTAAII